MPETGVSHRDFLGHFIFFFNGHVILYARAHFNEKKIIGNSKFNAMGTGHKEFFVQCSIDYFCFLAYLSGCPPLSGAIWILQPESACSLVICSPPRPMMASFAKNSATPVAAGELSLRVDVQGIYELEP